MQTTPGNIYQRRNALNLNPATNMLVLAFRGGHFFFIIVRDLGASQCQTLPRVLWQNSASR